MAHSNLTAGAARLLATSPAAAVHSMIKSDALPSQLTSMVDERGSLTTNAAELEAVLVTHFRNVFAVPPAPAAPLPHPPPSMLFDKSSIDERWWQGLTDCIEPSEVVATLADAKFVSAPGEDGVSTGVWHCRRTLVSRACFACVCSSIHDGKIDR
jgi:hypothetical protein